MTNIGSVSNSAQIHHTNAQPSFNWRKATITTLVTTAALGALYSLVHFSIGSEVQDQESSSALTLRSIGEVTSTAADVLQGIAAMGFHFAMAAPLHRDHIPDDTHHWLQNNEELFHVSSQPTMEDAIGYYLEYGNIPSGLLKEYGANSHDTRSNVDHFIAQAESMAHPADRAVFYRMARRESSVLGQDWNWSKEQENFHFKEANACFEASSYAKTPSEELSWLILAGEVLNLPIKGDFPVESQRNVFGFLDLKKEMRKEQIEIGSKIWCRIGELLLEGTDIAIQNIQSSRFMRNSNLQMHAVAAARCFYLAGNALSFNEEGDLGAEMYAKAHGILKNIDPEPLSDWNKVSLQREIADVSGYVNDDVALIEKKRSAEAYAELAKQEFGEFELKINQAILLFQAGHVASELEEKVALFTQARDVLEELWEKDSNLCEIHGAFYLSFYNQNYHNSWLYQARVTAYEYQLKLDERTGNSL